MAKKKLTIRQETILAWIKEYIALNNLSPTIREIAEGFGFKSVNGAQQHVDVLTAKGWVGIRRNHGTNGRAGRMARGIIVL